MGHQIAMCATLSGFQVTCTDTNSDILNKAIQFAPLMQILSAVSFAAYLCHSLIYTLKIPVV
jgi:hypothetical protein